MRIKGWVTAAFAVVLLTALVMPAMADHVIKIGGQCDRTGPTKNVGVELCPGIHDYIALVNKKGGVLGHKIEHTEIEHGYTVDRGVQAYERLKRDGAVALFDYGTAIVYPLTPRHMDDKIPAITPGFGRAVSIVGHLFCQSPSVSIKELKRAGFPMTRIVSFVWGAGEANIEAAGWDIAQGYIGMQFTSIGRDLPVIREIMQKVYKDEGKEVPKYVGGVYYSRGVLNGALAVEGLRLAIQNFGLPVTGDKVRKGYESIKDFDLQGFLPPMTVSPKDHEGGGWVRMYQVKGTEWVPVTDWVRGYREEVMAMVRLVNKK